MGEVEGGEGVEGGGGEGEGMHTAGTTRCRQQLVIHSACRKMCGSWLVLRHTIDQLTAWNSS